MNNKKVFLLFGIAVIAISAIGLVYYQVGQKHKKDIAELAEKAKIAEEERRREEQRHLAEIEQQKRLAEEQKKIEQERQLEETKERLQKIRETRTIKNEDYEFFENDSFYNQLENTPSLSKNHKNEIKSLYRKAKKAEVHRIIIMKCGATCDRFSQKKAVIWNRAAKSIYGISQPDSYIGVDLNPEGATYFDKRLKKDGIEEGYKDAILYEMWKDLGITVLTIDVLQATN